MGTAKPQISVLMAVYEPRMDWLRAQLESLETQTYPNLKLYVRDDCSPTMAFEEIEGLVQECIRSFPYEVCRNEENLGSNETFELMTREAEGEYFCLLRPGRYLAAGEAGGFAGGNGADRGPAGVFGHVHH